MFAKVFEQIFDSSIAQDYTVRHMFIDLLILADPTGAVDMTSDAIARRTNVPQETVERCISELCQPDVKSRSPLEDGKRLIPLDTHRDWGWKIVNYQHYRKIRDQEARRSYFRDYQRKRRKKLRVVKDKVVDKVNNVEISSSTSSSLFSKNGEEDLKEKPNLVPTAEDIYQAYPRHESKPNAINAIEKAIRAGFGRAFLLERTIAYAKTQPTRCKFTPLPATWFNSQRFNDDPKEWERDEGKSNRPKKPWETTKSRPKFGDLYPT